VARPIRYDLMRKAAQPYLHGDETIQAIFRATTAGRNGRAVLVVTRWLLFAALVGTALLVHSFAVKLAILLPCLAVSFSLIVSIMRYRYFAVTGQRILMLTASFWNSKARGIRTELPRSTRLGPASGPWYVIRAGGENLNVHEKFFDDIAVADDPTLAAANATVRRWCVSCGRLIEPREPGRPVSDMEWAHNVCPPETSAVAQDTPS
jgi:hypothetical protein